jgi:hypothetical protein
VGAETHRAKFGLAHRAKFGLTHRAKLMNRQNGGYGVGGRPLDPSSFLSRSASSSFWSRSIALAASAAAFVPG